MVEQKPPVDSTEEDEFPKCSFFQLPHILLGKRNPLSMEIFEDFLDSCPGNPRLQSRNRMLGSVTAVLISDYFDQPVHRAAINSPFTHTSMIEEGETRST